MGLPLLTPSEVWGSRSSVLGPRFSALSQLSAPSSQSLLPDQLNPSRQAAAKTPSPSRPRPKSQQHSLFDDRWLAREAYYAKEIIQKFPPDQYFILSLGQSNVIVDAFLRRAFPDEESRQHYFSTVPVGRLRAVSGLSQEQQELFWSAALPSQEILGSRQIVLVRSLHTGLTMTNVIPHFIDHLKRNHLNTTVNGYFWVWPPQVGSIESELEEYMLRKLKGEILFRHDSAHFYKLAERRYDPSTNLYVNDITDYHQYKPFNLDGFSKNDGISNKDHLFTTNPKHLELDHVVEEFIQLNPHLKFPIYSSAGSFYLCARALGAR